MIIDDVSVTYLDSLESIQDKILTKLGTTTLTVSIAEAARDAFNHGPGTYGGVKVSPTDDPLDIGVRETLERRRALFQTLESALELPVINASKIKERKGGLEIRFTSSYPNVFYGVELSPSFPVIATYDKVRVYDSALESLLEVLNADDFRIDRGKKYVVFMLNTAAPRYGDNFDEKDITRVQIEEREGKLHCYVSLDADMKATTLTRVVSLLAVFFGSGEDYEYEKKNLSLYYDAEGYDNINSALFQSMVMNDAVMSSLYQISGWRKLPSTLRLKDYSDSVIKIEHHENSLGIFWSVDTAQTAPSSLQKILASINYYYKQSTLVKSQYDTVDAKVLTGFELDLSQPPTSNAAPASSVLRVPVTVQNFRKELSAVLPRQEDYLLAESSIREKLDSDATLEFSNLIDSLEERLRCRIFAWEHKMVDGNPVVAMMVPSTYDGYQVVQKVATTATSCVLMFKTLNDTFNIIVNTQPGRVVYIKTATSILSPGDVAVIPPPLQNVLGPYYRRYGVRQSSTLVGKVGSFNSLIRAVTALFSKELKESKFILKHPLTEGAGKIAHKVFERLTEYYQGAQLIKEEPNAALQKLNIVDQYLDFSGKMRAVGVEDETGTVVDLVVPPSAPLADTAIRLSTAPLRTLAIDEDTKMMQYLTQVSEVWSNDDGILKLAVGGVPIQVYTRTRVPQEEIGDDYTAYRTQRRQEKLLAQICLHRFSEWLEEYRSDGLDISDEDIDGFFRDEVETQEVYDEAFSEVITDNFKNEKIKLPLGSLMDYKFYITHESKDPFLVRSFKNEKLLSCFYFEGLHKNDNVYTIPIAAWERVSEYVNDKKSSVFWDVPQPDMDTDYNLSVNSVLFKVRNYTSFSVLQESLTRTGYPDFTLVTYEDEGYKIFKQGSSLACCIGSRTATGTVYTGGLVVI
jgi:hypothetical protein